jgi:predicted RNA polymerase sigma factor
VRASHIETWARLHAPAIKVNRAPVTDRSKNNNAAPAPVARKSFRQRYNEIEARRTELIARLSGLSEAARAHPAYRRSLTLLNDSFRKGRLPQRLAIREAAAWLFDVLERLVSMS